MKKPISDSISARWRFATAVPMTTSDWPDRRDSTMAQPASRVMNRVAPRAARQRAQAGTQFRRQGDRNATAAIALHRRTRAVGRQFQQGGCAVELVTPEVGLFLQHLAL